MLSTRGKIQGLAVFLLATVAANRVAAHEIEVKGTVALVEKARVQVKVLGEDGKPTGRLEWFALTDKTKVLRGATPVTFGDAKIKVDERVVIIITHGDEAVVDWTCSMHPEVSKEEAGKCPICGMTLKERKKPAKAAEIRLGVR